MPVLHVQCTYAAAQSSFVRVHYRFDACECVSTLIRGFARVHFSLQFCACKLCLDALQNFDFRAFVCKCTKFCLIAL